MIAMKRGCLDQSEIQHVLSGQLTGERFESAIAHLDDCETCRRAVESNDAHQPWLLQSLRDEHDPFQSETACQVALWQMMDTPEFSRAEGPLSMLTPNDFPVQTLGPYDLIRPLGSGGMAAVYLAEHRRLRRRCAIKILPREKVDQPGWLERFDREMTTVAALEHPNVVRATDAGHENGWHYLVMEYLEGMDVGRIANRVDTIDVADACEIVRQAALGLQHVHDNGLVHRDVKPSNLMLTRDGTVKLLDLGLVLSGDDPLTVDDRLTTVGHLMGTMPYMAPEQLLDSRDVDSRADVYALGATLYRLIAGSPPHAPRGGLAKQVMAITGKDAARLDSAREEVDSELAELVARMLDRDPVARPASASAVAAALELWAKESQLRRLLRTAMRRPETEQTSHTAPFVSLVNSDRHSPPIWRAWALAVGFVALLVAGWVINIATDKGELIIQSEAQDVTVEVLQGDRVVEELLVQSTGPNEFTLRKGSYEIRVVGSENITLSRNTVTIGRGMETEVTLESSTPQRLYRGKTLDDWMNLLTREEDPNALGDVMAAVEVLTRNTDDRAEAAKQTLETARIWGGFVSSGPSPNELGMQDDNPSHNYMHHLTRIFPRYGTDGIPAIRREFREGNVPSRFAAVWMLNESEYYEFEAPKQWLEDLQIAVQALRESGSSYGNQAVSSAESAALRWVLRNDVPLLTQTWLHPHVLQWVNEQYNVWKKEPEANSNPYGPYQWRPFLDEDHLVAAVELYRLGKLELDWEWICATLFNPSYGRISKRTDDVVRFVADKAPQRLARTIHTQLESYRTPVVSGRGQFSHTVGPPESFYAGRLWSPIYRLGQAESLWPTALEIYAEQFEHPTLALDTLQDVRQTMIASGVIEDHADEPFQYLDAAINRLKERQSDQPETDVNPEPS